MTAKDPKKSASGETARVPSVDPSTDAVAPLDTGASERLTAASSVSERVGQVGDSGPLVVIADDEAPSASQRLGGAPPGGSEGRAPAARQVEDRDEVVVEGAADAVGTKVPAEALPSDSKRAGPRDGDDKRLMVKLEGIHKSFGARHVIRGLDLEVPEGETLCILGGSGTGKSVMLKHIMRLIDPDQGTIWLDGQDITSITGDELQAARSKLGVNFQFGALLNWLTVFENVALPLRENTRMTEAQIDRRVMDKLTLLNIPHARDQLPDEISGGMRKRAGLARAVVMEETVKVILYDEPTSGLDPISTAVVDDMIMELKERLKLTQLIVTHDMASAYRIADKIAVLEKGRVVQVGTADEIKSSTIPYVQQFVRGLTAPPDAASAAARERREQQRKP